jgi:hypothetical protein
MPTTRRRRPITPGFLSAGEELSVWDPYQFADWQSGQNPIPSPIKPLHLVGDYGQLHYRTGLAAPCYCPRATSVEVEREELDSRK